MSEKADNPSKPEVNPAAIEQGYEPSGVSVRGMAIFLVLFCVAAVLIQILVWFILKFYMGETRNAAAPKSAVVRFDRDNSPSLQPSPEHDTFPFEDLARMHDGENRIFAQMGWDIDSGSGEAKIPGRIVRILEARRVAPSTGPVLDAYQIPYVAATQPTGVTPALGRQTITPPPPYLSTQPERGDSK